MDIVKSFTDSFNIFKNNFITIILATLVAIIIGVCSLGILYIPMMVGVQMLFVKAKRGEPLVFSDIFAPIKRFVALFFGSLYIGLLVCVGLLLLIIPGLAWLTWWMFAALLIFDKNLGIGAAMAKSKELVRSKNLWMHLLFIILVGVVSNIGSSILYGTAYLLTMPLAMGAIACAYVDETN